MTHAFAIESPKSKGVHPCRRVGIFGLICKVPLSALRYLVSNAFALVPQELEVRCCGDCRPHRCGTLRVDVGLHVFLVGYKGSRLAA